MGASYVIKKINRKGLRLVELLSHGFIRIDGALLTYNRWKIAFEQITIPKNIAIKKKKEYFEVIDQLHQYHLDWRNDPDAAEVNFKKAEAAKAKKIADAKKAAAAKKIADAKAAEAKKIADAKAKKDAEVKAKKAKKAAEVKAVKAKKAAPDGEGAKKAN